VLAIRWFAGVGFGREPTGIRGVGPKGGYMLRSTLALLCFLLSFPANADSFYVAVKFECDKISDSVAVNYLGAYNERGEAMIKSLGEMGINPWTLVETDDSRITKMNTVKKECELSDGIYLVEIGPSPGNGNILGRCGGHMSAWVSFHKGNEELVRTDFEGDCFDVESPIRTRVLWRVGAEHPEITEIPHDDFYK
jgi:hypothetical protein